MGHEKNVPAAEIPALDLHFVRDEKKRLILLPGKASPDPETAGREGSDPNLGNVYQYADLSGLSLDGPRLDISIASEDGKCIKTYPVFQQKAHLYGSYSEYMERHGCACCSLTTMLAACCEEWKDLTPDQTIEQVEGKAFDPDLVKKNYGKVMARQMPVSLYGISKILDKYGVDNRYVGTFEDREARREIAAHLFRGHPVIIETSRFRRKNGHIVALNDKKYAGSYHTMILLGFDKEGQVLFTDSATRAWAGDRQRIKSAPLAELINYMFSQKNSNDTHVYFSRRRNTGGYILVG